MSESKVMVELGCGQYKNKGYIGIDRYPLPGVDMVADLNREIPLDSDSVDVILALHCLEHLDSLESVMQEIYRVCRHKAIVNIVAPYQNTLYNKANIYHKIPFNEHTFRYFTKDPKFWVSEEEYAIPAITTWGLAESDNSVSKVDFRTINIEFIYFYEYNHLTETVRTALRHNLSDVCNMIVYSLIVWKGEEQLDDTTVTSLRESAKKLLAETTLAPLRDFWSGQHCLRPTIYQLMLQGNAVVSQESMAYAGTVREELLSELSAMGENLQEMRQSSHAGLQTLQHHMENYAGQVEQIVRDLQQEDQNNSLLIHELQSLLDNCTGKFHQEMLFFKQETDTKISDIQKNTKSCCDKLQREITSRMTAVQQAVREQRLSTLKEVKAQVDSCKQELSLVQQAVREQRLSTLKEVKAQVDSYKQELSLRLARQEQEVERNLNSLEQELEHARRELQISRLAREHSSTSLLEYIRKEQPAFYDGLVLNNETVNNKCRFRLSQPLGALPYLEYSITKEEHKRRLWYLALFAGDHAEMTIEVVSEREILFNCKIILDHLGSHSLLLDDYPSSIMLRFTAPLSQGVRILEYEVPHLLRKTPMRLAAFME